MACVIAEPCIGTKDTACVDACPVDCIHPKKNKSFEDERPSLDEVTQLTPWNALTAAPVCRSALFRRFLRWVTFRRSGSGTQI